MNYYRFIFSVIMLVSFYGCAKKADQTENIISQNHFQFTYNVTVPRIDSPFTTGEIYVPLPQTNDCQNVHSVTIKTNGSYEILTDPEYNNKYAKVIFSDSLKCDINLSVIIDITREMHDNFKTKKMISVEKESMLKRFLQADSLVPIDGVVAEEASELIDDSMNRIEKAQALYAHLFETMKYDKSGEGWGRGDALYACDIRKGNCTDFHSLFIGMARSAEIPARFLIGFPLPIKKKEAEITGYHCWAEFYLEDHGWVPVDISEAVKDHSRKEFLFGSLDNDRLMFSVGRDIKIETASGEKSINFFIYPRVYVDGEPYDQFEKKFEFKKL